MGEGRTLLLTRPRAQSEAFAALVAERLPGRFRAVIAPLIEVRALPGVPDLAGVGGLAFTSANGVEQFAARSDDRSFTAWCVGEMTAAAACAAGFEARSAEGDVAALAALIAAEWRPGAGEILHLRGRFAAGDLVAALAAAGVPGRAAEIYDQRPVAVSGEAAALLAAGGVEVASFFSPRTALLFVGEAAQRRWNLSRTVAVSLSEAADAALAALAFGERRVAAHPGREGMLAALAAV